MNILIFCSVRSIVRTNLTIVFCLSILCNSNTAQSQNILVDTVPFGLDEASWKNANEMWRKKSPMVTILTRDSVAHWGQILVVNDTSLLLYEDRGLPELATADSLLNIYYASDILAIFFVKERKTLSGNTKSAAVGGISGAAIGVALHYGIPGNIFHPVFVVLAAGAGGLVGLGLGTGAKRRVVFDTTVICTQQDLKDTFPIGESELIWSTYLYTILQDGLPDSLSWTSEGVRVDSALTFDEFAASSRRITRCFPIARIYGTVSGTIKRAGYDGARKTNDMFMFNVGYRFTKNWALDFYLSQNTSLIPLHASIGTSATMTGNFSAISCSYSLLKIDRFHTKRLQCNAGLGVSYGSIDIVDYRPGLSALETEIFGVVGKLNFVGFVTRHIAVVTDVQYTLMQSIVLPSYEWNPTQWTVAIPEQILSPSYFCVGIGVRFYM